MNPTLKIRLGGNLTDLRAGEVASIAPAKVYRDAPDSLLDAICSDIAGGVPWRESAGRHLGSSNPWLLRIVAEGSRTLWLRNNPITHESWVLDVGAGWGQWAVPAAASARVVAVEPNPARLNVMRAIAEQEKRSGRMFFVGAPLEEVAFPEVKFDHIFCIGVLEWIPRFRPGADPQKAQGDFLSRLRQLLSDNGECVIGIENRLGLKYLLGAPDDHTGVAGISALDASMASRLYREKTGQALEVFTYSVAEYRRMLIDAGFTRVEFHAAFPDYKIPEVILPIADGEVDRYFLEGNFVPEHNGANGAILGNQGELNSHYQSLAALGIAGAFAPSFFIRAAF